MSNKSLNNKEYESLRDAIDALRSIMDDIVSIRNMLGCKEKSRIEDEIQEVRVMIRQVAEGELNNDKI